MQSKKTVPEELGQNAAEPPRKMKTKCPLVTELGGQRPDRCGLRRAQEAGPIHAGGKPFEKFAGKEKEAGH